MHHDGAASRRLSPAPPRTSQVALILNFSSNPSVSRERPEDAGVIGTLLKTLAQHRVIQKSVTSHDLRCIDHQQQHLQGHHSFPLRESV